MRPWVRKKFSKFCGVSITRGGKVTPEIAYLRASSKEAFAPLVPPKFLEEVLA